MLVKKNNFFLYFFIIISVLIPLTNVLEKNLKSKSIGFNDILPAFLLLFLIYFCTFFLIGFFLSSNTKKANFKKRLIYTSCIFYYFFLYGVISKIFYKVFPNIIINNILAEIIILLFWGLGLILTFLLIFKFYNKSFRVALYFIFSSIICINISLITKFYFFENTSIDNIPEDIYAESKIENINFNIFPDVYFIIFDSYTSQEYFNYLYPKDSYEINNFLKENNFIITDNNLSHYNSTQKSVPAMLNSNYFNDKYWLSSLSWDSLRMKSLDGSNVKNIFENNNYKINSFFCSSNYKTKEKYCEKTSDLSYIERFDSNFITAILLNSPLKNLSLNLFKKIEKNNKIFLKKFSEAINVINSEKTSKPLFNFIHFAVPHPPYVFDKNCNFKKISNDKVVFNNYLIDDQEFLKKGYYGNFLCATKVTKEIIANILTLNSDAQIILLSDHGPSIDRDKTPKEINYDDVMDKHAANISLLIDNKCREFIDIKNLTQVNAFRILTNCLSVDKNLLLPFYVYYNDYWDRQGKHEILDDGEIIKIKSKFKF